MTSVPARSCASAPRPVSEQGVPAAEEPANCIFEQVYFARPDSIMNGKSVYACRYDMAVSWHTRSRRGRPGHRRARFRPAARGGVFARERYSLWRGPYQEPLRGPYVYRTHAGAARHGRAYETQPLRDNIEGKRWSSSTTHRARHHHGAARQDATQRRRQEIHIRINSPEVIWPCFYGIDTDVQSQLISANKTVDEICEYIGADSLAFLSVEGLLKVMPKGGYCDACFTGATPWRFPRVWPRQVHGGL
ncbi:MAG: hypothetical protein ACLU0O_00715 [Collinsella sp.]